MDPVNEEQLDYGEDGFEGSHGWKYWGNGGSAPTLDDEQMMGDGDDFGDLYDDVNIVAGATPTVKHINQPILQSKTSGMPASDDHVKNVKDSGSSQHLSMIGVRSEVNNSSSNDYCSKTEQANSVLCSTSLNNALLKGNASLNPAFNSPIENPNIQIEASRLPTDVGSNTANPICLSSSSHMPVGPGNATTQNNHSFPIHQMNIVGTKPATNATSNPAVNAVHKNGSTSLFVGELHWWTTDADVENAASQFGRVKDIKFFDERASGKSRGYCQVEFFDPVAAGRCKEEMDGQVFHGRACVIKFASAQTLKEMGASYMRRNQSQSQGRGSMSDNSGRDGIMNHQGGDEGRICRGGLGRGTMNRGQGGGRTIRGRGSIGTRDMTGGGSGWMEPFEQSHCAPGFGRPVGPQNMVMAGFNPSYMGTGGGAYAGFQSHSFHRMMPQFQSLNSLGFAGVAPHINPAFFGQGMVPNGMRVMGTCGINGNALRMRMDVVGTGLNDEHRGKRKQSSDVDEDEASECEKQELTIERNGRSHISSDNKGPPSDGRECEYEPSNKSRYCKADRDREQEQRGDDENGGDREHTSYRRKAGCGNGNQGFRPRERDHGKRSHEQP